MTPLQKQLALGKEQLQAMQTISDAQKKAIEDGDLKYSSGTGISGLLKGAFALAKPQFQAAEAVNNAQVAAAKATMLKNDPVNLAAYTQAISNASTPVIAPAQTVVSTPSTQNASTQAKPVETKSTIASIMEDPKKLKQYILYGVAAIAIIIMIISMVKK